MRTLALISRRQEGRGDDLFNDKVQEGSEVVTT